MRNFHAERQSKSGSQLAWPNSEHRRVGSHAKGLAPGSLDPLDKFPGKAPVFLQIKLKPEGGLCLYCQVLDLDGCVGTHNKMGARHSGSAHGCQLSLRMHRTLVGNWGEEDRCCQFLSKERGA